MFQEFTSLQWVNVLIWIWQLTVILLNFPRAILHVFAAPWAMTTIMGVPDDQQNDTTWMFMRNLGVQ